MSEVLRKIPVVVLSSASAAVNSKPVRVGGNPFDVQITEPSAATLTVIQVSSDKLTWEIASDVAATSLTGIGVSYHAGIRERAEWARVQIATDSSGPRNFRTMLLVHKETD